MLRFEELFFHLVKYQANSNPFKMVWKKKVDKQLNKIDKELNELFKYIDELKNTDPSARNYSILVKR